MKDQCFDVVIVGAGLAGLYAAKYASRFCKVAVIAKTTIILSNSYWAQGGIAAAISSTDSPQLHYEDTIKAGRNLSNSNAVRILTEEGKTLVEELIEMGMPFDKANRKFALGLEGGHSVPRVLHAGGDATGKELVNFISKFVLDNNQITFFENTLVYKLIVSEEECLGVYAYDILKQEDLMITGKTTVIASGGGCAIYSRTTNPPSSIGEGISLAYDAGAEVESMEFIQFHPTSFYSESGETFLISEAVRGEGAFIVNHSGERFLKESGYAELSPRDVVTEAIFSEMKISGKPCVFLKLDHLNAERIRNNFSNIYDEALKFGIDITKDPVPVAPAAHYMIGGIKTGLNAETNIKRLYAVGEAASTGVHGANRLASNSLLECIVFGKRAIEHALKNCNNSICASSEVEQIKFRIDSNKEKLLTEIRKDISNLMWTNVGIIRSKRSLKITSEHLEHLYIKHYGKKFEYYSLQIKCLIEIATIITRSALLREESRGCHIREDFPDENQDFQKTIVCEKGKGEYFIRLPYAKDENLS